MLFISDNWAPVHPTIMAAMEACNKGSAAPYGADDESTDLKDMFSKIFGQAVDVSLVATGSAANALALSCLLPPWGAVLTHEYSHIHLDECGAPEFFSNGAKLIPLSGEDGKLSPTDLDTALDFYLPTELRRVTPKVISLTQASEVGTVYTVDELKILVKYAHDHGLKVHMDGARLANACAAMNVSLAAVTNEVGIDVVTLGATKNGCMIAEAVIFLNLDLAAELAWRQKRAGQSFSKQRYLSAQWLAYFENDLWLNLARHANTQALTLAEGLKAQGFSLGYPQHINEVFVQMDQHIADQMRAKGYQFYDWKLPGDPFKGKLKRFVTNFETSPQLINDFLDKLKSFS